MVDQRRKWRAVHQDIQIKEERDDSIYVVSGNSDKCYTVDTSEPSCDCPDWRKRTPDGGCKHILHVRIERGWIDPPPNAKTSFGKPEDRSQSVYASNWESISRQTRKRDNWTCQGCGAKGGPSGTARLEAHHINPKSKGGKDDPEELITLCHSCHEEQHGHSIPVSSYSRSVSGDINDEEEPFIDQSYKDINSYRSNNHNSEDTSYPSDRELAEREPARLSDQELKEGEPTQHIDTESLEEPDRSVRRENTEYSIQSTSKETTTNDSSNGLAENGCDTTERNGQYTSRKNKIKEQRKEQKEKISVKASDIPPDDSIFQGHSTEGAKSHTKQNDQVSTLDPTKIAVANEVFELLVGSVLIWLLIEFMLLFSSWTPTLGLRISFITGLTILALMGSYLEDDD